MQDAGGSYLWEPLSIDKLQEFFFLRRQLVQKICDFLTGQQVAFRRGARTFLQGESWSSSSVGAEGWAVRSWYLQVCLNAL